MKKDNNDRILKSNLSTLLKRFSSTDLISTLDHDFASSSGKIRMSQIDDNHILKKARINEKRLERVIFHIKERGINTPLVVTPKGDRFEILYPRIAFIACLKLKMEFIPCTIIEMEEEDIIVFLASKIKETKECNIVELSLLLNRLQSKYKYTQREIADMMQQSRSQITNIMRLKRMPEWILRDISNEKLSFGHARALSTLSEEQLNEIVPLIYENNLSVRDVEKMIYERNYSIDFKDKEEKLSERFNCKAKISPRQVTLTFTNEEERKKFVRKYGK